MPDRAWKIAPPIPFPIHANPHAEAEELLGITSAVSAKAFDQWSDFGSADFVYSYGTGFRYLIARKFKLRMGIDIAKGPEDFAYYIVFGSNWLK